MNLIPAASERSMESRVSGATLATYQATWSFSDVDLYNADAV